MLGTTRFISFACIGRWGRLNRCALWLVQVCLFASCGVAAFLLRFEFSIPDIHRNHLLFALPVWIAAKFLVFHLFSLDRGWWRFVSVHDLARLAIGNVAGSVLAGLLIVHAGSSGFPRSIYILDLILCFLATAGKRVFIRILLESFGHGAENANRKGVFIYGAGMAGVTLLREIRSNPKLPYSVLGFIDDDPRKRHVNIQGIKVLGSGPDLITLSARHSISEVLIALPSATGAHMSSILNTCHAAGVKCRTIPALAEIIENNALAPQIRDVAVEDLLGRSPVRLEQHAIRARLEHEMVLVTGAAGSIGSELCRQIARFRPRAIVGFEIGETALFHIDREIRAAFPNIPFYPEIGSVQNRARFAAVVAAHRPSIVYHAAAYKHVPMMELHPFEAVENNILGTYTVASVSAEFGVRDFVMISTDKAVRPTSVMGASKRVAEMIVHSMQNGATKFASVRFGNVLGSNGSVVPLFKQQIAAGGPVTVTHPEMRRYFMTIPEAAQLVLQASTMSQGGEIFVLDMGEPVRIVDLATNLILLSGFQPNRDIRIEFTGIRPGEKLYEELNTFDENTLPTFHEKIKIFSGNGNTLDHLDALLENFHGLCVARDERDLLLHLKGLIPDYNPSARFLQRVLGGRERHFAARA